MNKLYIFILAILPFFGFSQEAWRPLGSQDDFNQATYTPINFPANYQFKIPSDVDDMGRIYVAFSQNNSIKMRRFINDYWEDFAIPIPETIAPIMLKVVDNGTPYLLCRNGSSGEIKVLKFNGSNWEIIGNQSVSGGGTEYVSFCLDNDNRPYVTYSDTTNNNKIVVKKFNDVSWETIGTSGFSTNGVRNICIDIDSFNMPYVSYVDTVLNRITVKKFNSPIWETIGNEGFSNLSYDAFSFSLDNNNIPHVIYNDRTLNNLYGRVSVQKFDGTSWVFMGYNGINAKPGRYLTITFNSSNVPYINYSEIYSGASNNHYYTSVMKFTGSNWEFVGPAFFSFGRAENNNLVIKNDEFYSFCIDFGNNSRITVRKLIDNQWKIQGCAGIARSISKVVFDSNDVAYTFGYNNYTDSALYHKLNSTTDWQRLNSNFPSYTKMLFDSNNVIYIQTNDYSFPIKRYINGVIENVGNSPFSNYNYLNFILGPDNTPYVTYSDSSIGNKITVKKFNGVTWELIGTSGFSDNSVSNSFIAISQNNIPHVAYINNGTVLVKKFNGSNWVNIDGSLTFLDNGETVDDLEIFNNTVYVNYHKTAFSTTTQYIKKFENSAWNTIYNQPLNSSESFADFVIDHNGIPYLVIYNINPYHYQPFINVYKYNIPNWDMVGINFINSLTFRPSLSFTSTNIPCISYTYTNINQSPYSDGVAGGYAKYFGTETSLSTNINTYSLNKTSIYPNPVKTIFSISGNEAINEIEIYNLIGKRVLHKKNMTNEINIENLPSGIYVAKIKTDKGTLTSKLIKE